MNLEKITEKYKPTEKQLAARKTFLGKLCVNHPYVSAGILMIDSWLVAEGLIGVTKYAFDIKIRPVIMYVMDCLK